MCILRSAADAIALAPAKLNLFFEVLAKRSDGYHEIETLMCPIDVYDTLYCREEPGGHLELTSEWIAGATGRSDSRASEAPPPSENLAYRAVALLRERAGVDRGASLRLVKRIPAAAGLGGGSSDAAAALRLANAVWRLGWSDGRLASLAAELGSDVPFFLYRGAAVCRGRGERIEPLDLAGGLHFVVVRPPVGLSTAAVYRICRPASAARPLEPMVLALRRGDLAEIGRRMVNRLQPAAETLSPWIARLRNEMDRCGLPGHMMSGSGSAYFGLCWHAAQARRVAARLRARGVGCVFVAGSCRG